MIAVDLSDRSPLMLHICFNDDAFLFYQMNSILFIDFNRAACNVLKFDWFKMLNSYTKFSFNILFLRMTLYQSKR